MAGTMIRGERRHWVETESDRTFRRFGSVGRRLCLVPVGDGTVGMGDMQRVERYRRSQGLVSPRHACRRNDRGYRRGGIALSHRRGALSWEWNTRDRIAWTRSYTTDAMSLSWCNAGTVHKYWLCSLWRRHQRSDRCQCRYSHDWRYRPNRRGWINFGQRGNFGWWGNGRRRRGRHDGDGSFASVRERTMDHEGVR